MGVGGSCVPSQLQSTLNAFLSRLFMFPCMSSGYIKVIADTDPETVDELFAEGGRKIFEFAAFCVAKGLAGRTVDRKLHLPSLSSFLHKLSLLAVRCPPSSLHLALALAVQSICRRSGGWPMWRRPWT